MNRKMTAVESLRLALPGTRGDQGRSMSGVHGARVAGKFAKVKNTGPGGH
jgi:hypothetical protein